MTAAAIAARIHRRLDEDSTTPIYYTAAEVLAAINEAQRVFVLLTLCLETVGLLELDAAVPFYRMLTEFPDWLLPLRVRVNGGAKVDHARLGDFDALNPDWQHEAGTPERYAALGFDFFAIHPVPATSGDVYLDVTYAKFPARITTGSPEINEEHHPALIDYAIPCLRAKEGGQEFSNSLKYFDRFLNQADTYAGYTRARNKALKYDRGPFELKAYDRSRLIGAMNGKK